MMSDFGSANSEGRAPRAGWRVISGRGWYLSRVFDPSGQTLVETLVAMSLFVGVLVPLLAAIGNLLFDDRAERLQEALHLAQTEMAVAEAQAGNPNGRAEDAHGLTVERQVTLQGSLAQIDVKVHDSRKANRIVVHLTKTVSAQSP
jgi:hypothetical protein